MSKSQMEKLEEEQLGSAAFAWHDCRLSEPAQHFVAFCVGAAAEEGP